MQEQPKSAFGMDQNVAAGLAYLPVCLVHLVFSIAILATDKTNKLPRFHAVQSLLISACMIVGYIFMFVLIFIFVGIAAATDTPAIMFMSFLVYIGFFVWVAALFVGLIISMINAFQGKIFRLPLIGGMADKWSN
jgi:uncharacterized membrane protein